MKKNAEEFLNLLSKDNKLKEKVLGLYKKNDSKGIEAVAKGAGYPCTFDELKSVYGGSKHNAQAGDMRKISGGKAGWDTNLTWNQMVQQSEE